MKIFGECLRRFQVMLLNVPVDVIGDSGDCLKRFRGIFKKVSENVKEDSGKSKFSFFS